MELYLLRHGQTDWNRENRMQGRKDMPLNEEGMEQMRQVGKFLREKGHRIDLMVTSPLIRARGSAEIIADEIDYDRDVIINEPLFVERSFGKAEGLIWHQGIRLAEDYGAESHDELCQRAKQGLDKYLSRGMQSLLVVSHGGLIRGLIEVLSKNEIILDSGYDLVQGGLVYCTYQDGRMEDFHRNLMEE